MDFGAMIPVVAVIFGVPGFVAFVGLIIGHTRRMKELEIREKELALAGSDAALAPAVEALSDGLNDMRTQLAEMQERLEFTERLLVSGSPPQKEARN